MPERARHRRCGPSRTPGALVGWATAGLNSETHRAARRYRRRDGAPDAPGERGLGTSFWNEVEAHLRDARCAARHEPSVASRIELTSLHGRKRGFDVTLVDRTSGLDPRTLPCRRQPAGRASSFARSREIDDPRVVFELDVEAVRDIPTDQPLDDIRFDEWLERTWHYPDTDQDAKPRSHSSTVSRRVSRSS